MTKEIFFDLEFTDLGIIPLSENGETFLICAGRMAHAEYYYWAKSQGLHVRFSTAEVRDRIAAATF